MLQAGLTTPWLVGGEREREGEFKVRKRRVVREERYDGKQETKIQEGQVKLTLRLNGCKQD